MENEKAAAADVACRGMDHGQSEADCYGGVHGIAASFQDVDSTWEAMALAETTMPCSPRTGGWDAVWGPAPMRMIESSRGIPADVSWRSIFFLSS